MDPSHNLHRGAVVVQSVVDVPVVLVLHLFVLHLLLEDLQLADPGHGHLVLVRHQRPVEVDGKGDEHDEHGNEDDARGPGGHLVHVVELDPAQNGDLEQEQDQPEQRGEGPRRLYVPVQALVRRLVHQADAMQVADGLDVGQDACADHEGQHVHGYQEGCADGECD